MPIPVGMMERFVARLTKRNAIRRIESFVRIIGVPVQMMGNQITTGIVSAHLAGIPVSYIYSGSPLYVRR